SERFGPSDADYEAVAGFFRNAGFSLLDGSANRLTLSVRGDPEQVLHALDTPLKNYRSATRSFRANAVNPRLPESVGARVQAIVGLSDLAQPQAKPQYAADGSTPTNECEKYANDVIAYHQYESKPQLAKVWEDAYRQCLNEFWRWWFAKKPPDY